MDALDLSLEPSCMVGIYLDGGHTAAERQALHQRERALKAAEQALKEYKSRPVPSTLTAKEKKWERDAREIPRLEAAIQLARDAYVSEIAALRDERRKALPDAASNLIIRQREPGMAQADPYAIYYTALDGTEVFVCGFDEREDADARAKWWQNEIYRRNATSSTASP